MLDDLKYIHSRDKHDALGAAGRQIDQLSYVHELVHANAIDVSDIENIVFSGIGGSGLVAFMSLTWPAYTLPFEIWRRYGAPSYISKKTLLVAFSVSGNTEETLSAVKAAEAANSKIIVIACGGQLIERAQAQGYPHIVMPTSDQPRLTTWSGLTALVQCMSSLGLTQTTTPDASHALAGLSEALTRATNEWQPDVPTAKNPAKQLAQELVGTSPVIYAGALMSPAAYKWKISCNEAAKNIAWTGEIPEFSHNEFTGWTHSPVERPYSVVELRSSFEHPRVARRFEVTQTLLSGKRPHPLTVDACGDSALEHMVYLSIFGDFVTIYLAILNGVDPTELDTVTKFKSQL